MSNSVDTTTFDEMVEEFGRDIAKFNENGNKAAGTRARKSLMEISKLCKVIRAEIQTIKNAE